MTNETVRSRRVAPYLRVSSEDQAQRGTIASQAEAIERRLAADTEATLVDRYVDDGISGMIALVDRPDGARLIRDVAAGLVDEVWVYMVDRLGRDAVDLLRTRRWLDEHGIKLVSIVEGEQDLLGYDVQAVVADHYRREFLRRSGDGLNRTARRGLYTGGIVAYGYRVEGLRETAHLVPDENPLADGLSSADVVRLIYDRLARDRWSCRRIATELNTLGIPPHYARDGREVRRGQRQERTRGVWRTGRIRNLVTNPLYRGESWYGRRTKKRDRELISARVKPLVDVDVWEAAQATLAANRLIPKNTSRTYLLRGVLTCGLCGMRYGGTQGRKGAWWYRCGGRRAERGQFDGRCPNRLVQGHDLERLIWTDVERFLRAPGDILGELDGAGERGEAAAIAAAQEITLSHRLDALAAEQLGFLRLAARGSLTDGALDAELARIDRERAEVERMLSEASPRSTADPLPTATVDLLEQLQARLEAGLSDVERHEIVALLVRATVHSEVDETGAARSRVVVEYRFPGGLSTRTGRVHRGDQLEASRKARRPADTGDRDVAILEGLAQRLEDVSRKFGQLVEEQDAVVGQGHLARRHSRSAADHRSVGKRVVRRSHRCASAEAPDRTLAGNRRHDCGGEGLPIVERRQESRNGSREECLAGPRRTGEEQAVATGEGDLERPPCLELAADLGEVRHVSQIRRFRIGIDIPLSGGGGRGKLDPPGRGQRLSPNTSPNGVRRFAQRRHADDLDPCGEACLLDSIGRHDDSPDTPPREGSRQGQDARNRPDLAAEGQLADHREAAARPPDLLRAEQDSHRDREVERGACLAEIRRGEIDGDPPRRVDIPGVADRAADALASILERRVSQADDREPVGRQSPPGADLDPRRRGRAARQAPHSRPDGGVRGGRAGPRLGSRGGDPGRDRDDEPVSRPARSLR